MIHGRDEADAERKLLQMYLHCEILDRFIQAGNGRATPMSFEDVVSLVTK